MLIQYKIKLPINSIETNFQLTSGKYHLPLGMPKLIGIDFGLKRTGIAVTDDSQIIASPLTTVDSVKLMDFLTDYFSKNQVEAIVLGYPTRMDGSDTHITANVRLLKEALEKNFPQQPVHLQDERMTSSQAMQTIHLVGNKKNKKDKQLVDKIAATIILSDFLKTK